MSSRALPSLWLSLEPSEVSFLSSAFSADTLLTHSTEGLLGKIVTDNLELSLWEWVQSFLKEHEKAFVQKNWVALRARVIRWRPKDLSFSSNPRATDMDLQEPLEKAYSKSSAPEEGWLSKPEQWAVLLAPIRRHQEEALEILRHDLAHTLAQSVLELYPRVQVTIGPTVENGFYYDFCLRDVPGFSQQKNPSFSPEDMEKIEERMHAIIRRKTPIQRYVWSREKAIDYFRSITWISGVTHSETSNG